MNNYAPSLIGTVEDYEFGKRGNGTLSGSTMTGASQLILDGNRFQNATETPTTSSSTDIHAGISIYGNTTNHNTLNLKKNGSTPLTFTTVRAGYTKALNGGSDSNTLNLLDGASVTTGYAGYTEGKNLLLHPTDEDDPTAVDTTKNADAKNNTVNIRGGTLDVGGKLYGGYIATNAALTPPNNVSAGNASGNTINIESGTFGGSNEIYGGYTNGTGKATGNTINLGKSDGSLASTTLQNVFLYGGAASGTTNDVFTDNLLNVNAKGLTARNIKNFGKMKFNLGGMGTIAQTDQLLTLNGGATSGLDWAGVEVVPGSYHPFTPSTYNARLFTALHNGSGISFTKGTTDTYLPIGAKEKIVGDFEYIIDTATGSVSAQDVYVDGFRFRNHTATYSETPAHAEAWAGRTASGQTVTDNKLIVAGGTLNTAAYGGLVENKKHNTDGTFRTTAGTAKKNALEVRGGTVANAYGAKVAAAAGSAEENSVKITGGTISGSAYGADLAAATAVGTARKNKAEVANGSLSGSLYGAHTAGSGSLSDSEVKVSGGTITGSVYGSDVASGAGSATGSKITLTGGAITGDVYGGKTAGTGATTGHTLSLNGGTVGGNVYGGHAASGATTGNTVNLGNGTTNAATTVTGTIYGGSGATDTDNTLNVNTNATAGNIANFGMVNFNFNATFNQANPMLNLVGGSVTNFDWSKFKHTGNAPSGQSVLLQNMAGISVGHYTGAKEISSTGTHEYTIDTDTNTATAKQILYGGYQFKDANTTPTTGNALADIWGGRSVIGNTTTNNTLTINGTTHRDAYGGWTAGTGTTAAAKFDSTNNTVNLKAGTVRTVYGGFTSVQTGSATGNKVTISGGSVTGAGYGKVYGGYLSHASATGNATGNTVTITGGSMTDVYGGFTNGTGATTGNTVNLGTEADAVAAGTTIGTIYGGSKPIATNNTLNVYDSVTAGNIANFDTVNFKAMSSHIQTGDTLLTLNGGATSLDWKKLHVDNLDSLNASATSDTILTLMRHTANNINLANYSTTGTRGRIHSADYEADIMTDGNSATTQNIYLKGYRFRNNTASYAGGTATDAWGGRSQIGNKVENNKLTLTGGSATLVARGGLVSNTERDAHGNLKTTGDAEKNSLILNAGANTLDAYGAQVRTKAGSATENTATLNDGTVNGSLYGASLSTAGATGSATKNKVEIKGGSVTGSVYGSHIADGAATGNATASTVTVTGGTVAGDIYAGFTNGTGKTTGNTVNLGDGEHSLAAGTNITGTIHGGNKADATDNTLNINTNAQAGNIKNFDHLKFNLNSHALTQSTPVLRLNSSATGNLDWRKLDVNAEKFNAPIKTYEAYNLVLMENANGISFQQGATNTYTAAGGVKSTTSGDFEFTIDTANHTASSTQVTAAGFKFKNHEATYNETPAHNEAWAGRTNIGNKVEKNTLTVSGGTITTAAYGGLVINNKPAATTGDAEKNAVAVTGGTVANVYGAQVRTKAGSASENSAKIAGGTVSHVYGASLTAAGATGSALKSRVDVTGGAVTGDVYGGQIVDTGATGSVTESRVDITGGSVGGNIYGGRTNGSGFSKDNTVNITGGTLHDVYGGFAQAGKATGNTVNLGTATNAVAAGTSVGTIWGGNSSASGNTLNVNSRQANATDVKNFENVNFDAAHNVSHGDTLLRLTNGANTSIDWSKMKLKNLDAVTASPTTNHILTLVDSANDVTFTNYDAARARETKKDGDYEYVLNTDNATDHAKKVDVIGYRFANNHATYDASLGTNPKAWGGRTKVGNKVENNSLAVIGGAVTVAAYGGVAENFEGDGHGNYKPTGDAANNKLSLEGGTIADGYGADVRTQAGNATKNTVDLKGAAVTGNLYAGALTHASASGAATGNKVNLYSGTVAGDVYAGFARGSGTTTGNTVTIGDGANDALVTVTGKLYGGNKSATDNALDIKSKGAAVGSLAGFSKIKFNLGSSVADGDTVLTLNENTTLDYSTVEKPTGGSVSAWLGNVMQKKAHLFRMAAGKTLALNGYAPAAGSERAGDVEYSLVTDNNAAVTTSGSLDLSAYKWQNADVKITSAVPDAFGGKTVYGMSGETKNNKLALKTGAAVTNAIAGDTQTANGTAEGNALTVEAGTATNALGAKTKAGKAVKNKAVLQGGSVTNLKGAESAAGEAQENTAILQGGTAADVVGAQAAGDATENKAVLKAGAVTGSLKGATSAAKANKNTVEIEGGNVSGAKIMGAEAKGAAEENVVTIKAAVSNASTEITGAHSTHGNAAKNIVNVNATLSGTLVGGSAGMGDATDNVLNINANVTGDVYGARAHHASLRNTVNIKDGVAVTGNVTGGACLNANENTINIGRGSTVTGNVIGGNGSVENKNNIINLKGGAVTGDIIGGAGASADNNTLAVYHDEAHTGRAHDFDKIKNLHFYLGENIANENPTLLQLGVANKDIRGINVGLGVMGHAHGLKVNDVISLMKVNGGTLTTDATIANHVEAMHGVSLLYGFDLMKRGSGELIATVTKAAISDQAKSFVETRAGMTDFINRGADLLTASGMSAIRKGAESDKEKGKYDLWAVMSHGSMSVESGSQIDTAGWNLSLGWAQEIRKKDRTWFVSPFIEYGKGSYDSHLDDGTHGSGKLSYLGAGVFARMEKEDGLWLQGALHAGRAKSDYTGSISAGTVSNYDSSDTYVAAELSVGKTMKLKGGDKLDASLRYLWSHQNGGDVAIRTGKYNDVYDFAAVNSHRLRLGARYSHKESEGNELYAGLFWEYEFSGKVCASFMGYEAPSPSLRGGSALLELGWRFQPKDSRVSYDLNLSGWQGKREGVTGSARVNWAF
nr:autotransporter outer membrane beta-barrel domain-containing protein [uncultured Selenomonas sp.]